MMLLVFDKIYNKTISIAPTIHTQNIRNLHDILQSKQLFSFHSSSMYWCEWLALLDYNSWHQKSQQIAEKKKREILKGRNKEKKSGRWKKIPQTHLLPHLELSKVNIEPSDTLRRMENVETFHNNRKKIYENRQWHTTARMPFSFCSFHAKFVWMHTKQTFEIHIHTEEGIQKKNRMTE